MACRLCERCKARWPVRQQFLDCPLCGERTGWSSNAPTATAAMAKKADEVRAAVVELRADLNKLEDYAAKSPRLLSFPIGLSLWPTASDVPGPFIGAQAKP